MANQILIKKYSNRRLYDTAHKTYVTLDDISELIRAGNEVQVIDTQTGDDITKVILIQVVWESEKNKQDILPTSFLHMLIKYGNQIAKDFLENYFFMMLQPYIKMQDKVGGTVNPWQDMSWLPPGFIMPGQTTPEGSAEDAKGGAEDEIPVPYDAPSLSVEGPNPQEIEELQGRLRELEKKFELIDGSGKPAEKKKKGSGKS